MTATHDWPETTPVLSSIRLTIALLGTELRRRLLALAGLTLIGAALEVIGIGLVLPVTLLLVGHTPADGMTGLGGWLAGLLPAREGAGTTVFVLVLLLAVFVLKNLFLARLAALQMRFVGKVQELLSQRLFTLYMRQPYAFHLQRNSAELLRNAVIEVDQLGGQAVIPLLTVIVEGILCIAIAAVLVVLEPQGALVGAAVVAGAGWAVYALVRRPLRRWGEQRQFHEGQRLRQFQQGLRMVKEIKLLGGEETLFAWCRRHGDARARAVERYETLQRLPRLWFEVLFVASVVTVTLVLLARGAPREAIVPILGVFAAAAFRLIPSVSRILASAQALAAAHPIAALLHDELIGLARSAESGAPVAPGPHLQSSLELDAVGFRHAEGAAPLLRGLSLTVRRGERVCITGASGAGKSTLLDLVLGLLPPGEGCIRVDGTDISTAPSAWQRRIGYVPQGVGLIDDSLRRNVALGVADAQIDDEAIQRALRQAGLGPLVAALPDGIDSVIGEDGCRLSGGERQRIGIARALYRDPEMLLLDEPTSALDLETEAEILGRVLDPAAGRTVLMVAHRPTAMALCDRVFRLEKGRLVEQA